jgi:NAD(P)-dependent dehydrogenase (short-subunit alcohol dehydrogenase family)
VRLLDNRQMPKTNLTGRIALVTGGGGGIGRETCVSLAREGARVMVVDLVFASAQQTAELVHGAGGTAEAIEADVSSTEDCERMVRLAHDKAGGLDILINNAGIDLPRATNVVDTAPEDWDRVLAVNLRSVFLACKFALPVMVAQRFGSIINTASISGVMPGAANAAYAVSKAAVIALTKQVARDYAPFGVRSNCICPGVMQMPMIDYQPLWRSANAHEQGALDERRHEIARQHPMGRLVLPEDVAQAMVYLASDQSSYVTGQVIAVDGGWLVGR